uniref:EGF-like domain-containing protein n=1 Tax=Brugia malayi TaxID=6279 RepID=A0A7I4NLN8_BRUMA
MVIPFFLSLLFAGSSPDRVPHVGEIGAFCDPRNLPCTTPNTFCVNNICACSPMYEEVNKECILKSSKTLASKCKTSDECTGKGEYCNRDSGKCWCLSTHFVLGGKCKPVIYPGQKGCEDSRQCAKGYPGAICSQNKCHCPKGFKAKAFSCFKNKRYTPQRKRSQPPSMSAYDQISFTEKAKYNLSGFPTVHRTTVSFLCPVQQVFIEEVGICMTTRLPGESCHYSEQCIATEPGAFCQKLKCTCARGMKFSGNSCTLRDTKCSIHGYVWVPEVGQCMQVLPPGANGCSHSVQCSAAVDGAYCFRHKCMCPGKLIPINGICAVKCHENMTFSAIVGKCISAVKPGRQCQYSSQCQTSNAEMICIRGICRCSLGKVFTGDRCAENCLQGHIVGNNGICKQVVNACSIGSEQCLSSSSCSSGICECPFGTVSKSGECLLERRVPIGFPCNSTQICLGIANCIDGICQCPMGMVIQNGKCRDFMLSGAGGSCASGELCSGGSICTKSICLCPTGTTNQSGLCVPEQKSKCSNSLQCGENSYCDHKSGLCICQDGHQYWNQSCIPTFSRTLISPIKTCIINADCIAGTKCVANRCHCPAGEIFTEGRCQMVFAEPGESCFNGETCVSNYVCINGSCSCPDGEVSKDGNCITEDTEIKKYTSYQAEPNSPCNRGELCIGGSFCNVMDGLCRCPADTILQSGRCEFTNEQLLFTLPPQYIFNRSKDMLRRSSNHTRINVTRVTLRINGCESNDDCHGGSYCFGHRCVCPINMIMKGGLCQRMFPTSRERAGRRCSANYDCVMHNTVCQKGVCVCLSGYDLFGGTKCIPKATPFLKTYRQTVIPAVTTAITPMSNSIVENSKTDEMVTDKVISPEKEIKPDETSLGSTTFTALSLTDVGNERIPSSRQTEVIVNISGGVCNETTLCLFFSVCRSGICKCPLGTRISDTECKFMVDVSRLRQFEKLLHNGYSLLAYSKGATVPFKSQTTHSLSLTAASQSNSTVKVITMPANRIRSMKEVWPTTQPQIQPKLVTSMSKASRLGAYCDDEKAYCANGSVCIENQCVCESDDVMIDNMCVPRVHVRCKTSRQCPSRAQCIHGLCSCVSGTAMSRYGFCIPVNIESHPGMPCSDGETCSGFSKCIRGLCTCPPEKNNIVDNECVKVREENSGCTLDPTTCRNVNVGGPCNENDIRIQCSGNSICANGFCTCPSGERVVSGICIPINSQGAPGEICETGYTKCTGNSMCIDNYCKCISDQVAVNGQCTMQYRLVLPNHACDGNMFCTGGSICVLGVCKCPSGMYSTSGVLICRHQPISLIHADTILTSQPGYLRKTVVAQGKRNWQPLKDCPVTPSCLLPNCFCSRSGLEIPNGLLARDVPQIIILTFDGPITDRAFVVYKSLFSGQYRNPNGCPIKGTFFVSSEWNNYDQTQWLISNGHEVAVNSITHRNLSGETVERWEKEMVGMRDALRHFSYANAADITGVRAPQLELGGDNQFDMMEKYGFLYDNTMSVSGGPYWPQTLAYSTAWKCSSSFCPKNAHPNVWEIPINRFTVLGLQKEFTMLKEAVRRDDSPWDVAEMLEMNFNRSYNYNRAPYLLTADINFLNALPNEGAIIALKLFIEKISKNSDVYFVTATQALKWIKQPTRLLHIHSFEPWQCNVPFKNNMTTCETPSSCSFTCNSETRILRICGTCPQVYPNLGNPTGTGNSTVDR